MKLFWWRAEERIPFHTCPWRDDLIADVDSTHGDASSSIRRLEASLRARLSLDPADQTSFVGSGRTAIALGLRALAVADGRRRTIVLPSYTCRAVLDAVRSAELVPRFIDTTDRLVSSVDQYVEAVTADTLAVVVVNLCGKRLSGEEQERLFRAARDRSVYVLEDNCQAVTPRNSAARADMECYSLGFSKTLRATAGGVLVARAATPQVDVILREHRAPSTEAARCRMRYYRAAYGGDTPVDPDLVAAFRKSRTEFGPVLLDDLDCRLAAAQVDGLDATIRSQEENASALISTMSRFPDLYRHQGPDHNVFTRVPVLLPNDELAGRFWSFMNERGIELEGMYKPLHLDVEISDRLPVAESVWRAVYNLPNRSDLTGRELTRIRRALVDFAKRHAT